MKLILDAIEEKVRSLLLQYSREFATNGNPAVTLRFTGGWVRDKLLGRQSHDIDVAIDKATGEEFATGLHNFMADRGIDETGVHKIAVNPEKSKHLETATTRICGLDIDFVNLRSEEYANSDSRVPSRVRFGTPEEDAYRRDATLNALFYNLTTGLVEDLTGRGLKDLQDRVLRTPLNPAETFSDDPLRVLRLIRFVGQLNFDIAPDTAEAMRGEQVGPLLLSKVSSERLGIELCKLMESTHASKGIRYLIELGLGPYVFRVPDTDVRCSTEALLTRFNDLVNSEKAAASLSTTTPAEKGALWLGTLLQDLHDEDKDHMYVARVVQDGLKCPRHVKESCLRLVRSAAPFDDLNAKLKASEAQRSDLGGFVRACGELWRLCLRFNAARLHSESHSNSPSDAVVVCDAIEKAGLQTAYDVKPRLAGKELMALTGRKPGPWLQPLLQKEIELQLNNPDASIDTLKESLLKFLE